MRDDRVSYGARGEEHSGEIADAGPDHGDIGFERMGVDDGGDGVGRVMESVNEFKTERDDQRHGQHHVGGIAGDGSRIEVVCDVKNDVDHAGSKGGKKSEYARFARPMLDLAVE